MPILKQTTFPPFYPFKELRFFKFENEGFNPREHRKKIFSFIFSVRSVVKIKKISKLLTIKIPQSGIDSFLPELAALKKEKNRHVGFYLFRGSPGVKNKRILYRKARASGFSFLYAKGAALKRMHFFIFHSPMGDSHMPGQSARAYSIL